jgi:glycine/sarcosine/betaine reductase complex component A
VPIPSDPLIKKFNRLFKSEMKEVLVVGKLAGKKVLLLGERDGVAAPAMEESLKDCGADFVFSVTECFV